MLILSSSLTLQRHETSDSTISKNCLILSQISSKLCCACLNPNHIQKTRSHDNLQIDISIHLICHKVPKFSDRKQNFPAFPTTQKHLTHLIRISNKRKIALSKHNNTSKTHSFNYCYSNINFGHDAKCEV